MNTEKGVPCPVFAIVEDDPVCARQLQDYVERYSRETGTELQTTLFPDGLDVVENYRPVWDVILMDIEIYSKSGSTEGLEQNQQAYSHVL